MTSQKFICADCKGITEGNNSNKSSSKSLSVLLFFLTGLIIPSFRKKKSTPKKCQYCNSDFLLPADLPSTTEFLKQIELSYAKKNNLLK